MAKSDHKSFLSHAHSATTVDRWLSRGLVISYHLHHWLKVTLTAIQQCLINFRRSEERLYSDICYTTRPVPQTAPQLGSFFIFASYVSPGQLRSPSLSTPPLRLGLAILRPLIRCHKLLFGLPCAPTCAFCGTSVLTFCSWEDGTHPEVGIFAFWSIRAS